MLLYEKKQHFYLTEAQALCVQTAKPVEYTTDPVTQALTYTHTIDDRDGVNGNSSLLFVSASFLFLLLLFVVQL